MSLIFSFSGFGMNKSNEPLPLNSGSNYPLEMSASSDSFSCGVLTEEHARLHAKNTLSKNKSEELFDLEKEIGIKLQTGRCKAGRSIEEIADLLKVSPKIISAIEDGEFDRLTDRVFVIGLIRGFAKHINIDSSNLISAIKEHYGVLNPFLDNLACVSNSESHRGPGDIFNPERKWIKALFLLILCSVFFLLLFCFSHIELNKGDGLGKSKKKSNLVAESSPNFVNSSIDATSHRSIEKSVSDDFSIDIDKQNENEYISPLEQERKTFLPADSNTEVIQLNDNMEIIGQLPVLDKQHAKKLPMK